MIASFFAGFAVCGALRAAHEGRWGVSIVYVVGAASMLAWRFGSAAHA